MSVHETVTLTRAEYDALIERTSQLEDRLAAAEAQGDARLPHQVALAVIAGASPVRAFPDHPRCPLARGERILRSQQEG